MTIHCHLYCPQFQENDTVDANEQNWTCDYCLIRLINLTDAPMYKKRFEELFRNDFEKLLNDL